MKKTNYVLEARNINKSFSGVSVLSDVELSIKPGELHALMGENGAGKSTLVKIIMGIYQGDAGEIRFQDKPVIIKEASDALNMGISMIHQELSPIPEMTVAENIFLGREDTYKGTNIINKKKLNKATTELLEKYKLLDVIKPKMKMKYLNIAQIQMVEILKAISYNSKVIIMDEPTSSLSDKEATVLFEIITKLKESGVGIVYISHRMAEVFDLADRISVLRDGKFIGCIERKEFSEDKIIRMMVGRKLSSLYPDNNAKKGDIVLELKNFTKKGVFENVNLSVRAGEILGLSGLVGAGRSEVMRALIGYDSLDSGEIYLDGKKVKIDHPIDSRRYGIIIASEDRKSLGLVLCRSIKENISLQNTNLFSKAGFMNHRKESRVCQDISKRVTVKMNSIHDIANNLSGGNQQKVVLAKCLLSNPKVLIMDEPTRGIDIGAKSEIYKMMIDLAKQGIAIIMISSEMPELIGMSDRIVVMGKGQIKGELDYKSDDMQEEILKLALGGK